MSNIKTHVQVGLVDLDGIIRGKFLERNKFEKLKKDGGSFCSVVFAWDSRDELYENSYSGWFNGYPDDKIRVVNNDQPYITADGNEFYLLEFDDGGDGSQICPSRLANKVSKKAQEQGFTIKGGFEYEVYAFDETFASAKEKNFKDLSPLTPSTGGYSVLRQGSNFDFFNDFLSYTNKMNIPIEGFHPEAGQGALEFAMVPSIGTKSAEKAVVLKTFSKAWAQQRGLSLCYMAKPIANTPGSGGHLHISLHHDGNAIFFDDKKENNLSEIGRHFIGGQQKYMPELLSMYCSNVNSFTRLTPGFWAPTSATWGIDNRTCSLRLIGNTAESIRVETRVASADANPFLVFAAAIASGLEGILKKIEPTNPETGNAYNSKVNSKLKFPETLSSAAMKLQNSELAKKYFGEIFVSHFSKSRIFEEKQYRSHVSDWEMERYFEMI